MRPLLLPLVLLVAVPALAAPPAVPHPDQLDAIAPRMQKFVDAGDLAGAVCVVGRKDGVVHESAVGSRDLAAKAPMGKDAIFRIASMTKPITAIGIMILADEGKLSPDDDVAKHLPEFAGQKMVYTRPMLGGGIDTLPPNSVILAAPKRPVKLRDLLTHTSGVIPAYPPGVNDVYTKRNRTLAETTLAVALQPLLFEPGSQWKYCNPGIDTLGRVIEVASGMSYEDFLRKRVFEPLGMKDTTPYPTKEQLARTAVTYGKGKDDGKLFPAPNTLLDVPAAPKHPVPAGGLYSTGADLSRLYRMMLNKGELDGKRVLSEKAVAEMTRLQTGDIRTGFVDGMGFGYGWAVVREPKGVTEMLSAGSYGHGGAFGTQGWLDPGQDLFVVLLIQRTGLQNSDASAMRQALQEAAAAAVKK